MEFIYSYIKNICIFMLVITIIEIQIYIYYIVLTNVLYPKALSRCSVATALSKFL